jgi:hypothetical protein
VLVSSLNRELDCHLFAELIGEVFNRRTDEVGHAAAIYERRGLKDLELS